jgi:hypothetical protein
MQIVKVPRPGFAVAQDDIGEKRRPVSIFDLSYPLSSSAFPQLDVGGMPLMTAVSGHLLPYQHFSLQFLVGGLFIR